MGNAAADMLLLNSNNAINLTLYTIEVAGVYAPPTHTMCSVFRVILTINSCGFLTHNQPADLQSLFYDVGCHLLYEAARISDYIASNCLVGD